MLFFPQWCTRDTKEISNACSSLFKWYSTEWNRHYESFNHIWKRWLITNNPRVGQWLSKYCGSFDQILKQRHNPLNCSSIIFVFQVIIISQNFNDNLSKIKIIIIKSMTQFMICNCSSNASERFNDSISVIYSRHFMKIVSVAFSFSLTWFNLFMI